jgi:hypothetical protein
MVFSSIVLPPVPSSVRDCRAVAIVYSVRWKGLCYAGWAVRHTVFGVDTRLVDGQVFRIELGSDYLDVGTDCAPTSSSCRPTLPEVQFLVARRDERGY